MSMREAVASKLAAGIGVGAAAVAAAAFGSSRSGPPQHAPQEQVRNCQSFM